MTLARPSGYPAGRQKNATPMQSQLSNNLTPNLYLTKTIAKTLDGPAHAEEMEDVGQLP
jgi:hypothetical protein